MKILTLAVTLVLALLTATAQALEIKPYSAAAFAQSQQAGKSVALHFYADWCPVCQAQKKVIRNLPATELPGLTLYVVNYDNEKALRRQFAVRTQSTLIVFSGTRETGRLAGETDASKIITVLRSAP